MPHTSSSPAGFFGGGRDQPLLERYRARWHAKGRPRLIPPRLLARYRDAARVRRPRDKGHRPEVAANARQRLVQRLTMGWSVFEQQQVDELGTRAYLARQLDPESVDDFGLEALLEQAFSTLTMTPFEIAVNFGDSMDVPFFELEIATLLRVVYSPRQLFERMAVFWSDHFNISLLGDLGVFLKPTDDREVIRRHALGRFGDLLRASAQSPAMIDYLNNNTNVRGHPNENYARELMELHTLGVDGGFTQEDVREVARAFTGWSFGETGTDFGVFVFHAEDHDTQPKTVLGTALPAGGGVEDGLAVLDLLAAHPSTAHFLARKLLRYFWGYEPEAETVARVAAVYLETDGDIRAVLRSVLSWFELAVATPKLKRPLHLMTSALRALFADVEDPFFLLQSLLAAGHLPFNWGPPNGYPDTLDYWSGALLPRWNFAAEVLVPEVSGLSFDLSYLDPQAPVEALVDGMSQVLGGTFSETTRQTLTLFLAEQPPTPERLREALGLLIASPEFQYY